MGWLPKRPSGTPGRGCRCGPYAPDGSVRGSDGSVRGPDGSVRGPAAPRGGGAAAAFMPRMAPREAKPPFGTVSGFSVRLLNRVPAYSGVCSIVCVYCITCLHAFFLCLFTRANAIFEPFRGQLGANLGASWGHLGSCCTLWEPSWAILESVQHHHCYCYYYYYY